MIKGYNKGDTYEGLVFDLLTTKGLIAPNSNRGGAGNQPDINFVHSFQENNLEVKLDLTADYGQKMLKWSNGIWSWCVDDVVTEFYTQCGILQLVQDKQIIPNRYSIPKQEITLEQKKEDQKQFEDKLDISINTLYDFYSNKKCFYIQVGNYGFYHLKEDILDLGTPQFSCEMKLRLRAKTIHSRPVHNYGFYAVLRVSSKPEKSFYDIEEKDGRKFPPIR
jgi:hypothetical protein